MEIKRMSVFSNPFINMPDTAPTLISKTQTSAHSQCTEIIHKIIYIEYARGGNSNTKLS